MTASAPRHLASGANRPGQGPSAWPIQPTFLDADRGKAAPGFPAGPGLSAVDMAAACLCLVDAAWAGTRRGDGADGIGVDRGPTDLAIRPMSARSPRRRAGGNGG
jgi:hypothetical protein